MYLTNEQVQSFDQDGYLLLENLFTEEEVKILLEETQKVITEDCPRRILEKNGFVRSFFAPEQSSDVFKSAICQQRLVIPSMQLLRNKVYVHQSKVNTKQALVGDWWDWHQDYTFWKMDDGMPSPDVLTVMIYLNAATEFNGPMLLVPGTHKVGVVNETENGIDDENNWYNEYQKSTPYMNALTSDLKYTIKQKTLASWITKKGIRSARGGAGSVLFFHGNVFHASSNNLSPWDRYAYLITYNSINNVLENIAEPRPEFIASRKYEVVEPVATSIGSLDYLLPVTG